MEQTEVPPPPTRRRLTRISDGQMIAGVANGIASYLDVDPWLVRAAFLVLTFVGGSGVVIYIIGAIILPKETDPVGHSPFERAERALGGSSRQGMLWLLAAVLGVITINGIVGNHHFYFVPLVLLAIGLYLFRDRWETAPATTTVATAGTDAPTTITTAAYGQTPPRVAKPRRKRSALGLLILGAAISITGIALALTQSDVIHLKVQQLLAIPMVVLGIGLLVGAMWGRAKWLVIPAFLLLPFTVAAGVANVPFDVSAGSQTYRPVVAADVASKYELGAGRLVVDLSKVNPQDLQRTIDVNQGAGLMVVVVPKNVPLSVDASEGAGLIELLGRTTNGMGPELSLHTQGDGNPLQLQLRNGFGRLIVTDDPDLAEAS